MKLLTKCDIEKISNWLYQNGRELDVARFNNLFLNEEKENVLTGVTLYETDNGAFGRGVEPDNQNQEANVLSCAIVYEILFEAGYSFKDDDNEVFNEVLNSSLKYLFNHAPMEDDKWCVIEENNNKYPCAEWWKYQDDDHCCLPFYPTPILLGCILTFIKDDHKYYERSLKMGEKLMLDYLKYNISDKNDLHAMSILLKGLKKIGRVDNLYEEVHEKWLRDLDYALTRQKERYPYNEACLLYEIVSDDLLLDGKFKDLIIEHGQFLIDSRQTTGLWIPNWNWGNDDSYWDIASILWCSVLAVRNLLFLKNFNLIEEGAFDE